MINQETSPNPNEVVERESVGHEGVINAGVRIREAVERAFDRQGAAIDTRLRREKTLQTNALNELAQFGVRRERTSTDDGKPLRIELEPTDEAVEAIGEVAQIPKVGNTVASIITASMENGVQPMDAAERISAQMADIEEQNAA